MTHEIDTKEFKKQLRSSAFYLMGAMRESGINFEQAKQAKKDKEAKKGEVHGLMENALEELRKGLACACFLRGYISALACLNPPQEDKQGFEFGPPETRYLTMITIADTIYKTIEKTYDSEEHCLVALMDCYKDVGTLLREIELAKVEYGAVVKEFAEELEEEDKAQDCSESKE